ncbi:MAG: hypothetical protein ABEJ98_02605 [Candidatus Nanohaloarchaea archaeon]
MARYLQDLEWLILTVAVVGVVWSAAQDLYYGGGPLLSAGFSQLQAIFFYLIALMFLYGVVRIADSV